MSQHLPSAVGRGISFQSLHRLLVISRAKLRDQLNVRALLQGGSEGREFSPGGDRAYTKQGQ